MIRVLHVEDMVQVRRGFASMLARDPGLSLVGSAETAAEAMTFVEGGLDFELAVVDLGLPDGSGLEVIRALRQRRPHVVSLAFTIFDDPAVILDALRAGAQGYLLKHTAPDRLVAALKEGAAGGAPLTPTVARKVVESFRPKQSTTEESPLTSRELEVLEGLVRGKTYARIARDLQVSLSTVQSHVRAVYAKLEVNSKAEVTYQAIRRGMVSP